MKYTPPPGYHSANHHKYARQNPIAQAHLRRFLEKIVSRVAPFAPATILDAGCGEGFVTAGIAEHFPSARVTGVDLSTEAVTFARKHFGQSAVFEEGSIYSLPFEDGSFDVVVCSEVLEHLDAPDRALSEISRVARRGIVVTVPREPIFKWLNDFGQKLGLSPDPGHVNFWDAGGFERFMATHFTEASLETHSLYRVAVAPARAWRHAPSLAVAG